MKTLMQYKLESDALRDEARTYKTKSAQLKRYDAARELEREAGDLIDKLFKPGQVLTIERSINCTTPAGGGWGLNAGVKVEVLDVYNDMIAVDCGGTIFYLYLLGCNSRGWCSNNIFAFTEYLASQGQTDVALGEAKQSLESALKSFRGAFRCRHAAGLKDSETFKARLKQQLNWAKEAKLKLFKLQCDSITEQDIQAYKRTKQGGAL